MSTCKEPSCTTRASCNYKENKSAHYCSEHKKPGMINVVTPKCQHIDS